jgi:hypothetical protein
MRRGSRIAGIVGKIQKDLFGALNKWKHKIQDTLTIENILAQNSRSFQFTKLATLAKTLTAVKERAE